MSKLQVTMRESVFAAGGVAMLAGTVQTLQADEAAGLVQQNKATRYGTGWAEDPDSLTPAQIAAVGALVSGPWIPRGMDWLTETISSFDIYKYHVRRPTIWIDPSATSSWNKGNYEHPYNTRVAIETVVNGDMRGQVVGWKRGTTLSVVETALALQCYGTNSDPFLICPYGDAEALPIVTGEVAVTTWSQGGLSGAAISANIWKVTPPYLSGVNRDVYEAGLRLYAKTWNTNAETTLTVAGAQTYSGGVLYIRPYDSGVSPNLGQMTISAANYPFQLRHGNVADSGYVTIAGLHAHSGHEAGFKVHRNGATGQFEAITSIKQINIVGCKSGRAGVDAAPGQGTGSAVFGLWGAGQAGDVFIPLEESTFIANHAYDAHNNAMECAGTKGLKVMFNQSDRCGGNSIVELWACNIDAEVYYNWGRFGTNFGRLCVNDYGSAGLWFGPYIYTTALGFSAPDIPNPQDNTNKNYNNTAAFNLIENPNLRFVFASNGFGHKFVHNTCIWRSDVVPTPNAPCAGVNITAAAGGATPGAPGWLTVSNNIFLWYRAAGSFNPTGVYVDGTLGTTAQPPVGDKNLYAFLRDDSVTYGGTVGWRWNGAVNNDFAAYKTAMSGAGYAMDANSKVTGQTYGNLTLAQLNWQWTAKAPGAGSVALSGGITTLTTIGKKYHDGRPYSAATPTIGALLGG